MTAYAVVYRHIQQHMQKIQTLFAVCLLQKCLVQCLYSVFLIIKIAKAYKMKSSCKQHICANKRYISQG